MGARCLVTTVLATCEPFAADETLGDRERLKATRDLGKLCYFGNLPSTAF